MQKKHTKQLELPRKWIFLLVVVSIVLPLSIYRSRGVAVQAGEVDFFSTTYRTVPYDGLVEQVSYGYPLVYRQSNTYTPSAASGASLGSSSSDGGSPTFGAHNVIMNTVFWFALMYSVSLWYRRFKR